ncbi:MAG: branched-chain amino acid aminotransferase [Bacteroidales bacterium]|jgi:branched-chain amino acid aminotransferase|nr:branched-chain amino acid aminotransferase [Bacteroidales bacterium]
MENTKNIDWGNLPFGYYKTDYNVRCYHKNGKWGALEISSSEYVPMHMAATALHYGQEAFEGLKAYRGKDGRVRLFRWEENARRMRNSADGVMMAEVPDELFYEAITKVIKLNADYIPPYGTGASLYLRPLLIGSGPQVGVKPATEYMFMVFVTPVGPYFKEGFKPVEVELVRDYDRAAPKGTGNIKVGGNYAAGMRPAHRAHQDGFSSVLFLDSLEKKYVDEAGPANFFGIKNGIYVTPKSDSILPSITNMSLEAIANDIGLKVERRRVPFEELETFEETGACGTAAIISPIKRIFDRVNNKSYEYGNIAGPYSTKLYITLRAIQEGEIEDKHHWTTILEGL